MKKERVVLNKVLFWDVNYELIDFDKRARFVIERVAMYGFLEDWVAIKRYYGLEKIKRSLMETRYLDKRTLSFISYYFDVPKERFKCYNYRQSTPIHWDY